MFDKFHKIGEPTYWLLVLGEVPRFQLIADSGAANEGDLALPTRMNSWNGDAL